MLLYFSALPFLVLFLSLKLAGKLLYRKILLIAGTRSIKQKIILKSEKFSERKTTIDILPLSLCISASPLFLFPHRPLETRRLIGHSENG